ncbi:Uncharacterised protein [Vibrio cholerae]|nr:Uncharacterised protein [Vibrio cholerae]
MLVQHPHRSAPIRTLLHAPKSVTCAPHPYQRDHRADLAL